MNVCLTKNIINMEKKRNSFDKYFWISVPHCVQLKELKVKNNDKKVKMENLDGHLWFEENEKAEAFEFLRKLKNFLKQNYKYKERAEWMTEEWVNNRRTIRQLMFDSTETDGNKEPLMDYIISWTLRHAADDFKKEKTLWLYCRQILGKIIGKTIKEDDSLSEICVYKQERKIDLWVEFKLNDEDHAILIEDKYYGELREKQLEDYKQKFDKYYKKNEQSYTLHYCLISCIQRDDKKFNLYYDKAKDLEFKLFSLKELVADIKEPSGSDIFDEFWLEDW